MKKYVVHYELYPRYWNQQVVTAETIQQAMQKIQDTGRLVTGAETYTGNPRRIIEPTKEAQR